MRGKPYRLLRSLSNQQVEALPDNLGGDPNDDAPPGTVEKLAILQARAREAEKAVAEGRRPPELHSPIAPTNSERFAGEELKTLWDEAPLPEAEQKSVKSIAGMQAAAKKRMETMQRITTERLAFIKGQFTAEATAKEVAEALAKKGDVISEAVAFRLRNQAFGPKPGGGPKKPWKPGPKHPWVKDENASIAKHRAAKAESNGHVRHDPAHEPPAPRLANVHAEGPQDVITLLERLLDRIKAFGGLTRTLSILDKLSELTQ